MTPDFLRVLACPLCGGPLVQDATGAGLVCRAQGLRYRVDDGIALLLPEQGEPVAPGTPAAGTP